MLLYKFKGASDALYALDIAIHERLYCSDYASLNDPFEGQFRTYVKRRQGDFNLQFGSNFGSHGRIAYPSLDDLIGGKKVCSLTAAWSDVSMWALYGDSSRGLAFEFEVDENHPLLRRVYYLENLYKVESRDLKATTAEEVLSFKTDHWLYEHEWRFISDSCYVQLPGQLKRILLGNRVDKAMKEAVLKVAPPNVAVHMVSLDPAEVCMQIVHPPLDRSAIDRPSREQQLRP
ncbi:DUF2971 domain-containing protein [Xanthomonas cissicola]|uniref:DUF2971 domain-containing protein n=1 Tax=Xanthomonas cissicola TaxID=86186 RepID=A0ABX3LWV4_9XANT|nr:DUF2971 domain-containing protein [Xanthomonas cissicola]KAB0530282.1 DUF2971 domain-containing protein [Xanthomonas cissicola]OOW57762.1 hypothetical protein Xant_15145 [Xanthomonas cissicola]